MRYRSWLENSYSDLWTYCLQHQGKHSLNHIIFLNMWLCCWFHLGWAQQEVSEKLFCWCRFYEGVSSQPPMWMLAVPLLGSYQSWMSTSLQQKSGNRSHRNRPISVLVSKQHLLGHHQEGLSFAVSQHCAIYWSVWVSRDLWVHLTIVLELQDPLLRSSLCWHSKGIWGSLERGHLLMLGNSCLELPNPQMCQNMCLGLQQQRH